MVDPVLRCSVNPHFFQPLLPGFHSQLNIPLKFFSVHIEGRYKRNTVELRSDSTEESWNVKMEGTRLTVVWKEFASSHDFRTGDVVVFRQDGDLVFHVTCFRPSFCEIQYLQSTKNHGDYVEDEDIKNLKTKPELPSDGSCFIARIRDWSLHENRLVLPSDFVRSINLKKGSKKIVLTNEGDRKWTLKLLFREASRTFYMSVGWRNFCHENGLKDGDSIEFKLERNNTTIPILRFSTSDVKKSDDSTVRRTKRKRKTGENRRVTLTVKPFTLKYCRLYLTKGFTRDNELENEGGKKTTLLDKNGKQWPVSLVMAKGNTRMHLGTGLKKFLKAIDVKVYQSFVLELVWEDKTSPPVLKFCFKVKT